MDDAQSLFATPLSITIENFRCIERVTWKPHGDCVLVGPNGSGKSTILEAFSFMSELASGSLARRAIGPRGFVSALRDEGEHGPMRIKLALDNLEWMVEFGVGDAAQDDGIVHFSESFSSTREDSGSTVQKGQHGSRVAHAGHLESFIGQLPDFQYMRARAFQISSHLLREHGSAIIRNGEGAVRVGDIEEDRRWIQHALNSMFPGSCEVIELFLSGPHVTARVCGKATGYVPRPLEVMSRGFVSAFEMLKTVAIADRGATILFDQPENGLHPHAIARLVEAIRNRSEEKDFTVVFATHSPVLLDAFNDAPEDVWVADAQKGVTRLTDDLEPSWLATFRLGSIYGSAYGRQGPKRER